MDKKIGKADSGNLRRSTYYRINLGREIKKEKINGVEKNQYDKFPGNKWRTWSLSSAQVLRSSRILSKRQYLCNLVSSGSQEQGNHCEFLQKCLKIKTSFIWNEKINLSNSQFSHICFSGCGIICQEQIQSAGF